MSGAFVLAIDQGTSATKCLLVDARNAVVAKATVAVGERHPRPGWVEQDADEIWRSAGRAAAECLAQRPDARIAAVGLSTQRESVLAWRRVDGRALTPLLSWQDQRTAGRAEALGAGAATLADVRRRSGLPLDPMFSALKAGWLLDDIDPQRSRSRSGEICLGTVDSFLVARLGGGHVVEVGNASRTQLMNVQRCAWDAELAGLFGIPQRALPRIVPSAGFAADAAGLHPALAGVPVLAVLADSHAALFAHGAREPGQVKATLGTGSSVMGLAPAGAGEVDGLCLTIAWDAGAGPVHALEGNIRAAGATLRWLAELFGIEVESAIELASHGRSDGVCIVPGFNGLGAPWWDARAVGLVAGLTLASDRQTLLAAGLESIAHQVADVVEAMDAGFGAEAGAAGLAKIERLHVDGGPSRNARLLQTLAAAIGRPVVRCDAAELSALGAAHLAGLHAGVWDAAALRDLPRDQHTVEPQGNADAGAGDATRAARARWALAVARSRLAA